MLNATALRQASRILGTMSGLTTASLSAAFLVQAERPATGTLLVFIWLMLLGIAGAWAAWRRLLMPLAVVFLLSFIPVGLYLLGASGWLRWVGAATLGHGLAAALLWLSGRMPGGSSQA